MPERLRLYLDQMLNMQVARALRDAGIGGTLLTKYTFSFTPVPLSVKGKLERIKRERPLMMP